MQLSLPDRSRNRSPLSVDFRLSYVTQGWSLVHGQETRGES